MKKINEIENKIITNRINTKFLPFKISFIKSFIKLSDFIFFNYNNS